MDRKPSILHITPFFSPNVGGVETHLENLIDYLKLHYYKQIVMTYQPLVGSNKGKKKEVSTNLEIYRLSWLTGFYYKSLINPIIHFLYLTPYLLYRTLYFLLFRSDDVDIIHAHGINAAFIGVISNLFFRKPLVVSMYVEFNFVRNNWATNFYLWPLKRADKILVMTDNSKKELIKFGIENSKINVYSHWVNQRIFRIIPKTQSRKKLNLQDDKFIVLFVGRLTEAKGAYLLINIAKKLSHVSFVIVASGDLSDSLKDQASKLKNIHYIGKVDYDKLAVYYQATDILIVPSLVSIPRRTFEEGIPRVIMEALSCGVPIIGTDNGGIKEVIESGKVGFIVPSTTEDFVKAIEKIEDRFSEFPILRKRCLDYARQRFNIKRANIITDTYQEVYGKEN